MVFGNNLLPVGLDYATEGLIECQLVEAILYFSKQMVYANSRPCSVKVLST